MDPIFSAKEIEEVLNTIKPQEHVDGIVIRNYVEKIMAHANELVGLIVTQRRIEAKGAMDHIKPILMETLKDPALRGILIEHKNILITHRRSLELNVGPLIQAAIKHSLRPEGVVNELLDVLPQHRPRDDRFRSPVAYGDKGLVLERKLLEKFGTHPVISAHKLRPI